MIEGILFDKDGTLFDFHATWGGWTRGLLEEVAGGDACKAARLGARIGYDWAAGRFERSSIVIAGTPEEIAAALLPDLPGRTAPELVAWMNEAAACALQVEAVPLVPLLADLLARGLRLGVATNDAEAPAIAHLTAVGIRGAFDFVAGYDSGHGAKPGPGMPLAFAAKAGVAPERVVMVGDSRHDLEAGRAAGMRTVAVLTGPAEAAELEELADSVLPDIGHLATWIRSLD